MKHYRLILVSDNLGSPQQLTLTGKALGFVVAALSIFIFLNFMLGAWNLWRLGGSLREVRLAKERTKIEEQLHIMQKRADSLAAQLFEVSQKNKMLYASAGVPEPELAYAVGGPQVMPISKHPNISKISFSIDSLLFAVRQEKEALKNCEREFDKRERLFRHTPSVLPMKGFMSSTFGMRVDPISGLAKMHEGLDICAPKGTPVFATADGTVRFAGWQSGFGKMVIIDHIMYETRYAHLDDISVQVGQKVLRGDKIGTCGRTGYTTGVHLHYEVRINKKPVDPKEFILPYTICVD